MRIFESEAPLVMSVVVLRLRGNRHREEASRSAPARIDQSEANTMMSWHAFSGS